MPYTKQQVKDNIDTDITVKTADNSISPQNVGKNMKDIIDLIPDAIPGPPGPQGPNGLSAYQVAVNNGFTGTKQEWLTSLEGPQGPPGVNGDGVISYLPTPQIAKRRIFIPDGKKPKPGNLRNNIDSISIRTISIADLLTFNFPEEYYKEQFDIYFNSFSSDTNNWLSLPDKRIELCMVSNLSYKKIGLNQNSIDPNSGPIPGKGNKDDFHNAIVHPANSGYSRNNILHTIFSGGTATGSDNYPGIKQTEWLLDETSLSFGDNIKGYGLNKLNNPNITIELDVRDFFQIKGRSVETENLLVYPMVLDNSKGYINVKKIGNIKYNTKTKRVYKRNSVLFFRLSAGVESSLNKDTGVYQKRIFSDLSQPIYICPKIANFQTDINDYSKGYKPYIFGHTTKIGSK